MCARWQVKMLCSSCRGALQFLRSTLVVTKDTKDPSKDDGNHPGAADPSIGLDTKRVTLLLKERAEPFHLRKGRHTNLAWPEETGKSQDLEAAWISSTNGSEG